MKDIIGYGIARTAARDPAVIGIGKVSLMGPLNASRRDPGSQCRDKMSGGAVFSTEVFLVLTVANIRN